jgi:hypothetical protein
MVGKTNQKLIRAKKIKDDEFYTLREDVEKELVHYIDELQGKKILCPCDSEVSEFVKYLKEKGFDVTYDNKEFRDLDFGKFDVVVTNPPFSQIGDFYNQIKSNGVKFLILAPLTFLNRSEVFEDLKNRKIYVGKNRVNYFDRPGGGRKEVRCHWVTNIKEFDKPLIKFIKRRIDEYRRYDGTEIIHIERDNQIPDDYYELMGVSIAFLSKINLNQFDLVEKIKAPKIDGVNKFARVAIKRKRSKR